MDTNSHEVIMESVRESIKESLTDLVFKKPISEEAKALICEGVAKSVMVNVNIPGLIFDIVGISDDSLTISVRVRSDDQKEGTGGLE